MFHLRVKLISVLIDTFFASLVLIRTSSTQMTWCYQSIWEHVKLNWLCQWNIKSAIVNLSYCVSQSAGLRLVIEIGDLHFDRSINCPTFVISNCHHGCTHYLQLWRLKCKYNLSTIHQFEPNFLVSVRMVWSLAIQLELIVTSTTVCYSSWQLHLFIETFTYLPSLT